MPQPPRRIGSDFEDRAADHLLSLGWTLLGRRIKMTRGELDLVALDGEVLVVVEVKARTKGEPLESVTPAKAEHLRQAAMEFVSKFGLSPDLAVRFDAVLFRGGVLEHLRDVIRTD